MPMPETLRVKLISDDAGTITITPVVVREMTAAELIGLIVAQVGKAPERIRHILRAGTFVSGASRYRWEKCDPEEHDLERLLAGFPDPWPDREFAPGHCGLVVLSFRVGGTVELDPKALRRRRLLRQRSFFDALLELIESQTLVYRDYSHRENADCYRLEPDAAVNEAVREAASLLDHEGLRHRLLTGDLVAVDLYCARP